MKKRNMSLTLVLALILCLIPATAFASTTAGDTLSGDITEETIITGNTTINDNTSIKTGGSIVVKKNATLTIAASQALDLTQLDGTTRVMKIEKGGKLVVNGIIWSKNNFDDFENLGTMTVNDTASLEKFVGSEGRKIYIGPGGYIRLDSGAVVTSTPLGSTVDDGYKWVISDGTATTHGFPNSSKDELVVADGAVLDATNGLTLNSATGASANQLTVEDGGKLVTSSDAEKTSLASIFTSAGTVTQDEITSGTYTEDPSDYVADGYHAVKNNDGTWTVEKNVITKIAITLKEPVIGESPSTGAWTAEPTKDSVNQGVKLWFKIAKDDYVSIIEDRDWYKKWTQVKDDEKFQKDYYYAFITAFEPDEDSGYVISDDITVTLNGKKLSDDEAIHDEGWVEVIKVFGPLAEKSPATGDNNELGLFAVAGLISVAGVALMLRRKHSM